MISIILGAVVALAFTVGEWVAIPAMLGTAAWPLAALGPLYVGTAITLWIWMRWNALPAVTRD